MGETNKGRKKQSGKLIECEESLLRSPASLDLSYKKPLYIQMQENFQKNVLMPELAQKKVELAKKRLLFQPINHSEIKEHQRKHTEILTLHKKRWKKNNCESELNSINFVQGPSWAQRLENEEKKIKEEQQKNSEAKKELMIKKASYSNLVKYLHMPQNKAIKKLEFDGIGNSKSEKNLKNFGDRFALGRIEEMVFRPKKSRKKELICKKEEKKKVVKDYLSEIRKMREERGKERNFRGMDWEKEISEGRLMEDIVKVKSRAQILEFEAHKQENLLNNFSPSSKGALKKSERFNEMIISSIKAKLAVFEKFVES